MDNYLHLPKEIIKSGFKHTLICKGSQAYIYKQHVTSDVSHYIVFIKRIRPERIVKGIYLSSKEIFPKDEDFGSYAWTFSGYMQALQKFNEIENNNKNQQL